MTSSRQPRVVLCSVYPPTRYGIAAAAHRKAKGLHALGWDIEVITTTSLLPGTQETEKFPVHRDPSRDRMVELCRSADVIIIEGDALIFLDPARASKRPFVVVHHGQRPARWYVQKEMDPDTDSSMRKFFRYFYCRSFLNRASRNVAVSPKTGEINRLPRTVVIPEPLDLQEFPQLPAPRAPDERRKWIGFVGKVEAHKGLDVAIQTLARLPDKSIQLEIFGDGAVREQMTELANQLGVGSRVHFRGFVSGDTLNQAFRGFQVMLAPSKWDEPFCTVIAEAFLCGTPVIGSDRGGIPITVGPGGFSHPVTNLDAWVRDTQRILESDDLHDELVRKGQDHVRKNFAKEVVAREFDRLLREVIAESK